ncbi:hypothetical protein GLOIN_2v1732935 [Rhizophagus clarus]|uniref:Uncharacterized protein n=1 Tax=Rhizophagus clarus TaxID=94130 RepID=A0A8H3QXN7_9GLOM|nr:hypothetical protein GLOIN_2v1732935 [Rhizophagus clarus]
MWIVDKNWEKCTKTWLKQDDNTRELCVIFLMFRDFVAMFLDVEVRFDKWAKVRVAINRKCRNNGKANGIEIISEFNDFLRTIHMTVEDFEAVMK